jgi:hypothetical protein
MMYFLDFDRTTFDTDKFGEYLRNRFLGTDIAELRGTEFSARMDMLVSEGALTFAPGELAPFLYEDAGRFLRDKENGVMLLTFGNPAFQKAKIESALYGIPRISTIYTGEKRKGEFLAPHMSMYGAHPVFVDDTPLELEMLETYAPTATLYEMRRNGGTGDGRWAVITSLSALP